MATTAGIGYPHIVVPCDQEELRVGSKTTSGPGGLTPCCVVHMVTAPKFALDSGEAGEYNQY